MKSILRILLLLLASLSLVGQQREYPLPELSLIHISDNAIELSGLCEELMKNPSQELVDKACKKWVAARAYWELSEMCIRDSHNVVQHLPHDRDLDEGEGELA